MTSHECPISVCSTRCAAHHMMCRPHWFMVPKALRDKVWAIAGSGGLFWVTSEYHEARKAAIDAVEEKVVARGNAGAPDA